MWKRIGLPGLGPPEPTFQLLSLSVVDLRYQTLDSSEDNKQTLQLAPMGKNTYIFRELYEVCLSS